MPQWYTDLTSSQLWAAMRHYITFAFGLAGGVLGTLTYLSYSKQQDPTVALNAIADNIKTLALGVASLLTTIAVIKNSLTSAQNASPANQINSVVTNLAAPQVTQIANSIADPEGRKKLITAVAEMQEVRGIVANEVVAQGTPSSKVVSTPQEVARLPMATAAP